MSLLLAAIKKRSASSLTPFEMLIDAKQSHQAVHTYSVPAPGSFAYLNQYASKLGKCEICK